MPESQSTFLIGGYKALTSTFWCNFEDRLELHQDVGLMLSGTGERHKMSEDSLAIDFEF